jgi:hypothetical protein
MMPPAMHKLAVTKLFHEIAPGQTRLGFFGKDDRLLDVWFDPLHRANLIGSVHNIRIERVFPDQNRGQPAVLTMACRSVSGCARGMRQWPLLVRFCQ